MKTILEIDIVVEFCNNITLNNLP